MGCLSGLKFWKKKGQSPYGAGPAPRPYNPNVATAASRRQHHQGHHQHQGHHHQPPPYPAATYDEKARYPLQTAPYAGREKAPAARWNQGGVVSPQDPIGAGIKEKDEGVDDPDAVRRKKAAEEARLKAEREEQERLDFFQMM